MRTVTSADIAQITGYSAKYVRDNLTKRPNAQGDGSRRKEHCGLVPRPLQPEGLTQRQGVRKLALVRCARLHFGGGGRFFFQSPDFLFRIGASAGKIFSQPATQPRPASAQGPACVLSHF